MRRPVLLLALIALVLGALATGGPRADARATPAPLAGLEAPIPAQLVPGETATVSADGDPLRIRAAPGLQGVELTQAPDGTVLTVLEGTANADGYAWQKVRFEGIDGWAAAVYLVPSGPPAPEPVEPTPVEAVEPAPTDPDPVCDTRGTPPGLFGDLPTQGGSALVVWGGGTTAGIVHQAALRGVTLRSVWVLNDAGRWTSYIVGAPRFVNQRWFDHFPGGRIPSPTALFAIAEPRGTGPATGSIALPVTTANAPRHSGGPAPEVEAAAVIVVDAASGKVLHEHNARTRLPPASLTKIATALLAIEGSDLDAWVSADGDYGMLDPDSSLMGLAAGDCFTVRDLLYGLMLWSGNDAALTIARHVAGSDAAFVSSMNAFVDRLGLADTHFVNPHGLHDAAQFSTAYDLAMLTRYAMTLPTFEAIVGEHSWTTSGSEVILMRTLNHFLSSYDDADGVKTGFTEEAGKTLVASATRDGRRVIAVLLNAPDRSSAAATLIEWAFTDHTWPR
ncbi:MAG: SH3 domain-containing protein [Chloroflexi bacterium]|nr:SH3 domain-containing protein [Chloroflexota bacterium]